jgi:dTDP-4-dehydrorhamnose 3,5-epimerase
MIFQELSLPGAYLILPELREDERGFFARAFCQKELSSVGLHSHFVQNNISYNKKKGTVRGMHFQEAPHEEVKIVRCMSGAIYDVIIDLRPSSSSYKKWIGVELNATERMMIYIPKGFAHGFQTLQDDSEVFYWISDYYMPSSAKGYCWNDPSFNIRWPLPVEFISHRDQTFVCFR